MEHQASAVSAEEKDRNQTTVSRFSTLSIWGGSLFQVDVPSVKIHGELWFQLCKENTGLLAIHIHFNEKYANFCVTENSTFFFNFYLQKFKFFFLLMFGAGKSYVIQWLNVV